MHQHTYNVKMSCLQPPQQYTTDRIRSGSRAIYHSNYGPARSPESFAKRVDSSLGPTAAPSRQRFSLDNHHLKLPGFHFIRGQGPEKRWKHCTSEDTHSTTNEKIHVSDSPSSSHPPHSLAHTEGDMSRVSHQLHTAREHANARRVAWTGI
ncbi:hypothetical protein TGPRC2_284680 [Toxoplasma gondii TgCatPRC2]|uniref:Uncharacterized protein n=1 Tax=Toxoplasma gondii TgCatPRC2 TaxID=1130821 RepID=A0A151GZB9_TOXGO|nr:hypothetical protein TGPRC2_284680 [Toxoplasma gondii TgCatPRC2]